MSQSDNFKLCVTKNPGLSTKVQELKYKNEHSVQLHENNRFIARVGFCSTGSNRLRQIFAEKFTEF